jgi:hypothetical protein
VWEPFVTERFNTDGEVGNKERERLSGVVCNPTSTAIMVQYVADISDSIPSETSETLPSRHPHDTKTRTEKSTTLNHRECLTSVNQAPLRTFKEPSYLQLTDSKKKESRVG